LETKLLIMCTVSAMIFFCLSGDTQTSPFLLGDFGFVLAGMRNVVDRVGRGDDALPVLLCCNVFRVWRRQELQNVISLGFCWPSAHSDLHELVTSWGVCTVDAE
jgi:hypothetical protein